MDTLEVGPVETEEKIEFRELLRSDRCDKCGGAAYFLAIHIDGNELTFCGHHGLEFMPTLIEQGFQVQDNSANIPA